MLTYYQSVYMAMAMAGRRAVTGISFLGRIIYIFGDLVVDTLYELTF